MTQLKSHHYILGKDHSGFGFRASTDIGKSSQTARISQTAPWGGRQTHFTFGSDSENKTSDYQMRFQKTDASPPHYSSVKESSSNKAKIEADSTTITDRGGKIPKATTTSDNFK